MSGLEVAGLVLGTIPVAIAVLQFYKSRLSSFASATQQISTIERELENERVRLRATFQNLLAGVVPLEEIHGLLQNPRPQQWKRYKHHLRLKLWITNGIFDSEVETIYEAVGELKRKLAINSSGKTKLNHAEAIMSELRLRATFTLRKDDYEDVLNKIKMSNFSIARLFNDYRTSESDNRAMSEHRMILVMRKLYNEMFVAVSTASSCSCHDAHNVLLELEHKKRCILPQEDEEDAVNNLSFHVALGSGLSLPRTDNSTNRTTGSGEGLRQQFWASMELRTRQKRSLALPINDRASKRRKVHFEASPASHSVHQLTSSATSSHRPEPPTVFNGLCRVLSLAQKQRAIGCYGVIPNSAHAFELHPHSDSDISRSLTLRESLSSASAGLSRLDFLPFEVRLRAALDIATGVLYLFGTPWLPDTPTLDDFLLLLETESVDDIALAAAPVPTQTFVRGRPRPGPERSSRLREPAQLASVLEQETLAILKCGTLLAQIILGESISDLEATCWRRKEDIHLLCRAGLEAASRIEGLAGERYSAAVQWCFTHVQHALALRKKTQWLTFHREVVVSLEEGLKSFHDS